MNEEKFRLVFRIVSCVMNAGEMIMRNRHAAEVVDITLREIGATVYEVANALEDYHAAEDMRKRDSGEDIPF